MSPDPGDAYFADGMTEELISTTSMITGLTLIARTSVMRYKDAAKGIEEIGNDLNVGSILEGSVRRQGKRLRITVQLIDVESQGNLWTQSYDRDFDDIFAVQSDIAKEVAEALKVRMLPGEARRIEKRTTKSSDAYTLYLKGRFHWNRRNKEQLFKAIEYFKQAVEIDPDYALAYSGMADCYTVLAGNLLVPNDEAFTKAKPYALKAVRLDDSSAEAHTSLADVFTLAYQNEAAEKEFKRALELNPNYATCHQWYGQLLTNMGRHEQALHEFSLAQQLDPVSPIIHVAFASLYTQMEKYDLAEEQLRKGLDIDPDFVALRRDLWWTYLRAGKYDLAEKERGEFLRITNDHQTGRAFLAVSNAYTGKIDEAKTILAELERTPHDPYLDWLYIQAYMRFDREKAIMLIEKEYEKNARWSPDIMFEPWFSSIRSDPRIVSILKKLGIKK